MKKFIILYIIILGVFGMTSCNKCSTKNKSFIITFDTDGGSIIEAITANYGTEIVSPADPIKEGYTFTGWDQEIPSTMPSKNLTIKAKWTINQYVITFDTDGGSLINPIIADYGTIIPFPLKPTKAGYTFLGWDQEIPSTMPATDLTIKANWKINEYTITYELDGGDMPEDASYIFTDGSKVVLPTPTRQRYFFKGWYDENDNLITDLTGIESNVSLYAKWIKNTLLKTEFAILGDSISSFYLPNSPVNSIFTEPGQYYFPKYSIIDVKQTWWYKTIDGLSTKLLVNNSYSGGTVHSNGISSGNNEERIEKFFHNGKSPDVIIIYLGINDTGGDFTKDFFKNEYQGMIDKIQTRFPYVQIFVCTLPYTPRTELNPARLRYNEAITEIADAEKIPLIDFASAWTSSTHSNYLSDALHPNGNGMNILAKLAIEKIREFYDLY